MSKKGKAYGWASGICLSEYISIYLSEYVCRYLSIYVGIYRSYRTSRPISESSVEDSVAEWSKAIDLKSIILWMRRFKSCHCRFYKKVLSRVWEYGYGGCIGIVEYKTTWPSG